MISQYSNGYPTLKLFAKRELTIIFNAPGGVGGNGVYRCLRKENFISFLTHLVAVVEMVSTDSMIRWRAVSVPIVMSVPQKSLSIEPTIPTMFR